MCCVKRNVVECIVDDAVVVGVLGAAGGSVVVGERVAAEVAGRWGDGGGAPTHWGRVGYRLQSQLAQGRITPRCSCRRFFANQ